MSDLKLQVLVGEMLLHEDPRKLQSLDDLHNIHLTLDLLRADFVELLELGPSTAETSQPLTNRILNVQETATLKIQIDGSMLHLFDPRICFILFLLLALGRFLFEYSFTGRLGDEQLLDCLEIETVLGDGEEHEAEG